MSSEMVNAVGHCVEILAAIFTQITSFLYLGPVPWHAAMQLCNCRAMRLMRFACNLAGIVSGGWHHVWRSALRDPAALCKGRHFASRLGLSESSAETLLACLCLA